tara:strand:+ start:285 stop:1133 length:849 start_codon:yes stop_codon:yes gene_type:complete
MSLSANITKENNNMEDEELDFDKITYWINNPEFNTIDFYKLRDYMIKEMGFNGDESGKNWPYGLSALLVKNNYIEEAQKLQLKLFNNVENLIDIYSKVDKYVISKKQSQLLNFDNNGFIVLDYLAKKREPFNPDFFFKNINITLKYTISFCTITNMSDYLALGNFSENTIDDWLYKIDFFNDAKIIKKNKFSLLFKNSKNILLFLFWNGKYLDMNLYYDGNNKNVLKNITKCNKCRVVRIFSKEGDLYDIRVEHHRKLLPNTGEIYKEAEADFDVLKSNMCI